jgi:aquaporin Z
MSERDYTASIARRLTSEAFGTFLITATAIGVDAFYYTRGDIDYASRWLARGLATSAAIYAFSEASGAHLDPVVTIAFSIRGVFAAKEAALYIVAQFLGAFAASVAWLALAGRAALSLGASHPGSHFGSADAVITEAVCTFALVLTILMTAQNEGAVGKQAAVAVGFIVAACGFAAGPVSGASMNPARTLAPQILAGTTANVWWIYVVGPLAGACVAVGAHTFLCGSPSRGLRKAARGAEAKGRSS